jgi:hypothetical protein
MGNTVGSLEIPILLHARKNLVLEVTERQKDILVGCVLGDAYISRRGQIRIEQSYKQTEYLLWKHQELSSLAYLALPRTIDRFNKNNGKKYQSSFFSLRQYFRPWRLIFYPQGKKVFPKGLSINPLSLAIWYMDDGCWTGKKCIIATEGFDDLSIRRIQSTLHSQYKIASVVGKNRKLLIMKKSHVTFYKLVSSNIVSSMKYKIPNPVTTFSAWWKLIAERSPEALTDAPG